MDVSSDTFKVVSAKEAFKTKIYPTIAVFEGCGCVGQDAAKIEAQQQRLPRLSNRVFDSHSIRILAMLIRLKTK